MFFVEQQAHDRQHQVDAKPDEEMRVQEDVGEDTVIHEIKERPNPNRDIQKQADNQARVVRFTRSDPQCNVSNASKEGKVGNPQPVLIVVSGEQPKGRQDNPDQDNVDVKDETLADRLVFGLKFQDVDVEKLSEAARKNILFGFVQHIEGRLQEEQKEDKVGIFDKGKEKDEEKDGKDKAYFGPFSFQPTVISCESHHILPFSFLDG
jgi:hypothetical protein